MQHPPHSISIPLPHHRYAGTRCAHIAIRTAFISPKFSFVPFLRRWQRSCRMLQAMACIRSTRVVLCLTPRTAYLTKHENAWDLSWCFSNMGRPMTRLLTGDFAPSFQRILYLSPAPSPSSSSSLLHTQSSVNSTPSPHHSPLPPILPATPCLPHPPWHTLPPTPLPSCPTPPPSTSFQARGAMQLGEAWQGAPRRVQGYPRPPRHVSSGSPGQVLSGPQEFDSKARSLRLRTRATGGQRLETHLHGTQVHGVGCPPATLAALGRRRRCTALREPET